ncbi:undecaprenyldiphospho-muramoylpentapeptide beta-N-acetylglucosaminyltransferase [Aneurinibacillus thermoaerophilus]|jgi:UDP-N-acetylglucosamine--N-acetylmuramyl-(pentapeptide) pyrophosphoryl-undecaprenol N-acetylglucosamine transferase|uniref:UDP-N-acetylglucosamine--N-acetylmuramyl-(pentapeptide) pyrophosphoryl-undecaprenol N-acetylglucosamine transferase n=1 Tax=Aneurinibacillus thermoaerophilus TaxID=143495 RepID=A0A1G7W8F8_ANETH|nr:undecaprenyldiphospho-muramoylpentapeptide beta-N-acetylglucosaminyltransferase [Aneurinibacillus thermoaerophilus]MED0680205.1 undecaprenyldiphospho-muramoylpentapeptide beta-N-acetylglucosaminyltransferase [Aneurinibacillus thermoaerophilus]MED0756687.1 undecaprenyldiphospho-muramoylpentapeptide beta-N-acetylglucosaminyltransferase [Aneurinibacillus thermoaerophilus]MED0760737.1 undecaprenyldiphospho-muramoylpentapeptide beta-N-acetylglucosaminyltransferase [Aneurinibacillus thermoaerophilu
MDIVISGGGTGGHIYPALALIKEIKRHEPGSRVLYIGTEKGLESEIVPKEGIPFESVYITGFKRSLSFENVKTIMRFFKATRRAKRLIREFKPDVVVGTGGYVCGPVVYAASSLGIPTLIHEQNVIPGLTNKFLSRYADRVAVTFSGSASYFPQGKTVVTGNPRATEVAHADGRAGLVSLHVPSGKKYVLIVGGSRGAKAINEAVIQMAPKLCDYPAYHFIYVTGEVHYDKTMEAIKNQGGVPENMTIRPFIYNMPEVLAGIDLIVNRAGASFLAEITALGLPSILIPSPYVTNNHQEKNGRWLEEQGASRVITESQLNGSLLLAEIDAILRDSARVDRMRQAAKALGQPNAATLIYKELQAITCA